MCISWAAGKKGVVCLMLPEVWSAQPSWDLPCGRVRSVWGCAACPSARHARTSSTGWRHGEATKDRQREQEGWLRGEEGRGDVFIYSLDQKTNTCACNQNQTEDTICKTQIPKSVSFFLQFSLCISEDELNSYMYIFQLLGNWGKKTMIFYSNPIDLSGLLSIYYIKCIYTVTKHWRSKGLIKQNTNRRVIYVLKQVRLRDSWKYLTSNKNRTRNILMKSRES